MSELDRLRKNVFDNLQEIERLNKELEVAKTNEETYRLEMLDITKRLGLDELTLFDDVKDKAERLNNIIEEVREYIELGMNFDSLGVARTKKKLLQILDKGE